MVEPAYALFLGCMIPYREGSYEISARRVAEVLGIRLVEMPDSNCCGLPLDPAHHEMATALAARDLCIAEKMGLNIMTLCNGCAGTLTKTNKKLKQDRDLKKKVNEQLKAIGMEFQGKVEVKHIAQVLASDIGVDRLRSYIKRPLSTLAAAPYIGCHIFRPSNYMEVKDPELPSLLGELIAVTGAQVVEYVDEFQCCGASEGSIDNKLPLILAREKIRSAKSAGAQVMVTLCPACHQTLDGNQPLIERTFQENYNLPVLHYTQLLGLAIGLSADQLALNELRVRPTKVLEALEA
jgi:heterodisulfide reductase subunit B